LLYMKNRFATIPIAASHILALLVASLLLVSCHDSPDNSQAKAEVSDKPAQPAQPAQPAHPAGTFGYDLDFLMKHDSVIVLSTAQGNAQVIVSPKYQAKVFTSTTDGNAGHSLGWINYKAFTGSLDSHMNAYGGENRIWLGPEGGRFSLFFPKDSPMVFQNWKTPAPFDTEAWKVKTRSDQSVTLQKDMQLVNYAGTSLSISIVRKITIVDQHTIDKDLDLPPDTTVKAVGYETVNSLTNTGHQVWSGKTGMPCIWILDMFPPSPSTVILVSYKDGTGPIATTNYFGEIPADRIKYKDGVLLFKADGKSRGKLGINPKRAVAAAGSYDAQNRILTLVSFDLDQGGKYLNQEWNTVKPPFSGDAVNAYNDGPLASGGQMGPFYEIESVSPAAFLSPRQSLTHKHIVFHFTGSETGLDKISRQLFGVSLDDLKAAF
jgi:hypothetical protein